MHGRLHDLRDILLPPLRRVAYRQCHPVRLAIDRSHQTVDQLVRVSSEGKVRWR